MLAGGRVSIVLEAGRRVAIRWAALFVMESKFHGRDLVEGELEWQYEYEG